MKLELTQFYDQTQIRGGIDGHIAYLNWLVEGLPKLVVCVLVYNKDLDQAKSMGENEDEFMASRGDVAGRKLWEMIRVYKYPTPANEDWLVEEAKRMVLNGWKARQLPVSPIRLGEADDD